MKKRIFILITLLFLISSCGRDSITETVTSPPVNSEYVLNFQVLCQSTNQPVRCRVDIYKNGNLSEDVTNRNDGWFYSGTRFEKSDVAKIVLRNFFDPTMELYSSRNLSPESSPGIFLPTTSSAGSKTEAIIYVNYCN